MRRALVLGVGLLALAPAAASAAPFGELAFAPVAGTATCLRATGAPGELVRASPTGARFERVTAAGIADAGGVATGAAARECPQAAGRPGGSGVVAQGGDALLVATRDPGGSWGPVVKLANESRSAAVAVADSGAAVVAWGAPKADGGFAIEAARRAPGGTFGAPVKVADVDLDALPDGDPTLRAGIAADGEVVVVWTGLEPLVADYTDVEAAIATAGGGFSPPRNLGYTVALSPPSLAVAADGRALVTTWTRDRVRVAERAPGGATFSSPRTVARADDPLEVRTTAAIASGGGAVVGWQSVIGGATGAVARAAAGSFGAPVQVAGDRFGLPAALQETLTLALSDFDDDSTGFPDDAGSDVRAAIMPDGRALLTWAGDLGGAGARYAAFPLAGGAVERGPLGSAVRLVTAVTPLVAPDGTAAVAWGDRGRVHAALEGAVAGDDPAPPTVTLGQPRKTVLSPEDALTIPVRCSAACDVSVTLPGRPDGERFVSLPAAGVKTVSFTPLGAPIAPLRRGPVHVTVRYAAPGARASVRRDDTVLARRLPPTRTPKVRGLKVTRRGGHVWVTFRTDVAVSAKRFITVGTTLNRREIVAVAGIARIGPRSYRAILPDLGEQRIALLVATDYAYLPPIDKRVH